RAGNSVRSSNSESPVATIAGTDPKENNSTEAADVKNPLIIKRVERKAVQAYRMRGACPRNATRIMIVTKHNNGRNSTRIPTDSRAHHGIAGASFGSIRAGTSGPSFISVISKGLMTILSIGLQNDAGHNNCELYIESGAKRRSEVYRRPLN